MIKDKWKKLVFFCSNRDSQRAEALYNQYLTDKNKQILWKQRKITLDFFITPNSSNCYDVLGGYLLPYNIGFIFNNGTKEIKKYCDKFTSNSIDIEQEPMAREINDLIVNIRTQLMQINFYIEENDLQYKTINEVSENKLSYLSNNRGDRRKAEQAHENYIVLVKMYYKHIFPILANLEKSLDFYNGDLKSLNSKEMLKIQSDLQEAKSKMQESQEFIQRNYDQWNVTFN